MMLTANTARKAKNRGEQPRLPLLYNMTDTAVAKQIIPKTRIQDAILNPPIKFWGTGAIRSKVEEQFEEFIYPLTKKEGGGQIHMIWVDNPCRTTCWNDGNKTIEAYRSSSVECIVAQHPWLENDCLMADIILPSNTTFEVEDIVPNSRPNTEFLSVALQRQAIKPIGESKSDYEVVLEIARKLGMYEAVTEGKTIDEWLKYLYDGFKLPEFINWKKFQKKEYYASDRKRLGKRFSRVQKVL